MHKSFVHMKENKLYNSQGEPFILEGVGLNAWLLPEGYMFNSYDYIDRPRRFYAWTEQQLGKKGSDHFWKCFRENFIVEKDITLIKELGFNSIRVPFDYEILFYPNDVDSFLKPKREGFKLLDQVIKWCDQHQIYIILDLHAAPGGQTGANIDNSKNDQPEMFMFEHYQKQTIYLWRYIADRYKNEKIIAAYDLLNEPLPKWFSEHYDKVLPLYEDIIKAIRSVDQNHLITIEGVHWATDFSIFEKRIDDQLILQFHKYWSEFNIESLSSYIEYALKFNAPLFMGEGGEHYLLWYSGAFKMYRQLGISWNFWSYKKMTNHNSICSFQQPNLWQESLKKELSIKADNQLRIFDELIQNIKFDASKINRNVVNHLFQKDTFETFGFAFDIDVSKDKTQDDEHIFKRYQQLENFICFDKEGNEMSPNFSLNLKLDIDTPFPYLQMKLKHPYNYSFQTSIVQAMKIKIYHLTLDDYDILIDNQRIKNVTKEQDYLLIDTELEAGNHILSIKTYKSSMIKKIQFIVDEC